MKSIGKRIILSYFIIILITVLIMESAFIIGVKQYYYGSAEQYIKDKVDFYTDFYYDSLYENYYSEIALKELFEKSRNMDSPGQLQIIDKDGKIIMDSSGFLSSSTGDFPDFKQALSEDTGTCITKNKETGEDIIAVSKLVEMAPFEGVIRYMVSLSDINKVILSIKLKAIIFGITVIAICLFISVLISKSIIIPIKELQGAAVQIAKGNYDINVKKANNDELGDLTDTLNHMAEEIKKTERLKNEFIASITHELRTPLTAIKGWSETLSYDTNEFEEEMKLGLDIIDKETDRLIGMVEELLDFSKLESGRSDLKMSLGDINIIVKEIVNEFIIRAKNKNIQITLNTDTKLNPVRIDENRIRQAIIILIDNALKFTGENGIIAVAAGKKDHDVFIEVKDSGEGITEEDLAKVKNKFYKGSSKQAGSGLGLSICSSIMKLHGGRLELHSKKGEGTQACMIIPDNM